MYTHETTRTNDSNISGYLQILKFSKLSLLGICEYASSSLFIYADRKPFSNDGEHLKANKGPHCTVVITQTTACAWPGDTFAYQSPSQFNFEFSQKGIDLYVKITFIFADGNLSLKVSDQTGETLEVKANFTNLLSREALSMPCT